MRAKPPDADLDLIPKPPDADLDLSPEFRTPTLT